MALRKFDKIMRFFLVLERDQEQERTVIQAICSLSVTSCFEGILETASSLNEGITSYKTTIARDLAAMLRNRKKQACIDE